MEIAENEIPWSVILDAKKVAYEREDESSAAISSWAGVETVARAIQAERERCAKLVEAQLAPGNHGSLFRHIVTMTANRIRSGVPA